MAASEAVSLLGRPTDRPEATAAMTKDGRSRDRRAKSSTPPSIPPFVGPPRPGRPAAKTSSKRRLRSRGTVTPLFRRTWALPLALMLGFVSLYAVNPSESNIVRHFLFLSYKLDGQDGQAQYGKGAWDFAFVFFYTIFLSFTREFVMHELLQPLAVFGGIKSRGKQSRFTEQMYTACYIAFVGPLGLYTMKQTPGLWFFETRGMYETYPHTTHTAVFKFYYLFQAAFWVQQVVVMLLGQEKPRKDFKELIAHHIITISLIFFSYRFHFTYIGIAIYTTHDISDFFLAISKSLNYLDHWAQSSTFALCIAVWIYLRHYINLNVLYSIATEYSTVGPFGLDWEKQQFKCRFAQVGTFGLLASLQGLNLFWLYCLFRSAYRFVVLGIAKDDRSEAEESEVEVVEPMEKARVKGGVVAGSKNRAKKGAVGK